MSALLIFVVVALYFFVGAAVLAWFDMPQRYNMRLLEWSMAEPLTGLTLVIWPWVAWRAAFQPNGEQP